MLWWGWNSLFVIGLLYIFDSLGVILLIKVRVGVLRLVLYMVLFFNY